MSESPLTTNQACRAAGLENAVALYSAKTTSGRGLPPSLSEVCHTADRLAEYIRTGVLPR